jgi:hypothetical protein
MTVIACRDGLMAADSLETTDRGLALEYVRKIHRSNSGCIYGVAGYATDAVIFGQWVDDGMVGTPERHNPDSFAALLLKPSGELLIAEGRGPMRGIRSQYYAIGVGRELAVGAMAMGATADEAVLVATQHSVWCGGPVHFERLPR